MLMLSRLFVRPSVRSLPITLYPNRKEALFHLTTSTLLAIGGYFGLEDNVWMGSFCMVLFSTMAIVFLIQIFTNVSYLRLDYEGFTINHLGHRQTIPWYTVRAFVPMKGSNASVGWWYISAARQSETTRALTGVDGMLSDNYGMKRQHLAELMNDLRLSHQLATFVQTQTQNAPR